VAVIRRPVSKFLAALTDLLALLEEAGAQVNFYVVGGAALGLGYGARSALTDIDARMLTSTASQKLLDEAIAKVADKHDLQSDWINAKASSHFVSDEVDDPAPVTLSESKSGKLVVQVASLDVLVAMKIHAGRPQIGRPDLGSSLSSASRRSKRRLSAIAGTSPNTCSSHHASNSSVRSCTRLSRASLIFWAAPRRSVADGQREIAEIPHTGRIVYGTAVDIPDVAALEE